MTSTKGGDQSPDIKIEGTPHYIRAAAIARASLSLAPSIVRSVINEQNNIPDEHGESPAHAFKQHPELVAAVTTAIAQSFNAARVGEDINQLYLRVEDVRVGLTGIELKLTEIVEKLDLIYHVLCNR